MKPKLLLSAAAAVIALAIPSCVIDPGLAHSTHASVGITTLPHGYKTVTVGGSPYYFVNNSWYRRSNGRYFISSRPHGYKGSIGQSYGKSHGLAKLPHGYKSFSHSGIIYYSNGSNFYRRSNGRYIRSSRPHGYKGSFGRSYNSSRGLTKLPHGYRSISHRGKTYYSNGSNFYRKSNGYYIKSTTPSGYKINSYKNNSYKNNSYRNNTYKKSNSYKNSSYRNNSSYNNSNSRSGYSRSNASNYRSSNNYSRSSNRNYKQSVSRSSNRNNPNRSIRN